MRPYIPFKWPISFKKEKENPVALPLGLSWRADSNRRPAAYHAAALPPELRQPDPRLKENARIRLKAIIPEQRLRGWDLNPRPPGYEPDELPDCSTPRQTHAKDGVGAFKRLQWLQSQVLVERGGFEPPKAYASRFTVCPVWPLRYLSRKTCHKPQKSKSGPARNWSWRQDSNLQPGAYKAPALPVELRQPL